MDSAVHRRWLLAVVLLVQVMVALDMSVVNVALPHIKIALGFTPGALTWVVNAYALTFGGLMMLGGRIGDVAGRRRTLLAGLAIFGLASLGGGLARDPGQLIAARAVQGVGAAALTPVAFALITVHFPAGPARSRALGLWGASAALGGTIGVLAGGLLTQSASWRAVLFVNIPVVAFAFAAALFRVPVDGGGAGGSRPDVLGALLVTAGITALVLGVVRTQSYPWGSPVTLVTLGLAAVLLTAFVLAELRTPTPLLRIGLLTGRPVIAANLFVLLAFSGQFAAFYFVSLYLQQVVGYGPAATGYAFTPFCVGITIGTIVATRTVGRVGPRFLLTGGGAMAAAGLGWFGLAMGPHGGFLTSILGPSMVVSVGLGLCLVPAGIAATIGVRPDEAGMASGLITSSRQVGGSIGLAVLATIAVTVTRDAHSSAHLTALASGYAAAVEVAAGMLALAALAAFLLLPGRRRGALDAVPAAGEAPPADSRVMGVRR
jgi:EmrB/QacA subfamily drug resistance transporter